MAENQLFGVSLLAERIRFDRWGFLGFALVGSMAIIASKAFEVDPIYVSIGAVAAMAVYAFLVTKTMIGKLRGDQAGDNCYYLGLIYTLSSLAYAIFTFDPNDTAATIVQGFGIALATTIWGLILRVSFSQTRVDIADIEENARLELSQAAGNLKAELAQVVVSMNDFGRQTRQSILEAQDPAVQLIKTLVATSLQAIETLTTTSAKTLDGHFVELGVNAKKLTTAAGRVVLALDGQANSIERLKAGTESVSGQMEGLSRIAGVAASSVTTLEGQISAATDMHKALLSSADAMRRSAEQQLSTIRDIDAALAAFQRTALERLEAIEKAPGAAMKNASDTMVEASSRVRLELDQLVATHRLALQGITDQLKTASEAASANSAALAADLATSQSNVGKVHAALVEMTGNLAAQVERRSQP